MFIKHLLGVVLLCTVVNSFSQYAKGPVNSYVYALVQDNYMPPDSLITNGVRAFRVDDEVMLKNILDACKRFLEDESAVFLMLLDHELMESANSFFSSSSQQNRPDNAWKCPVGYLS